MENKLYHKLYKLVIALYIPVFTVFFFFFSYYLGNHRKYQKIKFLIRPEIQQKRSRVIVRLDQDFWSISYCMDRKKKHTHHNKARNFFVTLRVSKNSNRFQKKWSKRMRYNMISLRILSMILICACL